MKTKSKIIVIVHNLRSTENVGSIFRTSEAVGVGKIYLTGYTPSPLDRFGRENKKLVKASLGAEKLVKWEVVPRISVLLNKLKSLNYELVALEQDQKSVEYKKIKLKSKVCIIVGNEVEGIEKSILNKVDVIAEIPMRGEKESLNVANAFAILAYHFY